MKNAFLLTMVMLSSTAMANRESGGRVGATAVYVIFSSPGTGIDYKTHDVLTAFVTKAQAENKVYDYTVENWGREGEVSYCVNFGSNFDRVVFIESLAPTIINDTKMTKFQRTRVLTGFACHEQEKATEQDITKYVPERG